MAIIPNTYIAGITNVILPALATDVLEIAGSSTKTVKIRQVWITGKQTTGGQVRIYLAKRSSLATGGTPTTNLGLPLDSGSPASTATIRVFSTVPAVGALVNFICGNWTFIPAGATLTGAPVLIFNFDSPNTTPIILNSATETVCVNLGVVTVTGGSLEVNILYTEE